MAAATGQVPNSSAAEECLIISDTGKMRIAPITIGPDRRADAEELDEDVRFCWTTKHSLGPTARRVIALPPQYKRLV